MTAKATPQRPWRDEEDDRLRALYDTLPASAIAAELGRSKAAIKNRVNKLGLTKGHNAGQFEKGMVAWNKGMKGLDIGGKATRFKPGSRNGRAVALYRPIGSERVSKDGYLERKISDGLPMQRRWRAVHLLIWEAAHGPLPAGHALIFKDGNKQHIVLDNLELITRAELCRRNSYHNYGPEVARLVQLRGAVTRQINKRKAA